MPQYMIDEVNLNEIEEPSNHIHVMKQHVTGVGKYENYNCDCYKGQFCRLNYANKSPT